MLMRKKNEPFDFVEHEIKMDKFVKMNFESMLLSNAKWRKCFKELDVSAPELQVIWKFIGSNNQSLRHSLPSTIALGDRYLNSHFWFGPCYYKEIEWLDFPRVGKPAGKEKVPGSFYYQDIDKAKDALCRIGQWPIEETKSGFRINGYVAKNAYKSL